MKNLSADETPPFDETLNIRGEVCPYTFVRSKLKLEDMDEGQVLRVIVDYPPAIKNVPRARPTRETRSSASSRSRSAPGKSTSGSGKRNRRIGKMGVKVRIPTPLQALTGNNAEVVAAGGRFRK